MNFQLPHHPIFRKIFKYPISDMPFKSPMKHNVNTIRHQTIPIKNIYFYSTFTGVCPLLVYLKLSS